MRSLSEGVSSRVAFNEAFSTFLTFEAAFNNIPDTLTRMPPTQNIPLRQSTLRQLSFETLFCRAYMIEILWEEGPKRTQAVPIGSKGTQGDPKESKGTQAYFFTYFSTGKNSAHPPAEREQRARRRRAAPPSGAVRRRP